MNLLNAVVVEVLDTPKYYRSGVVQWWQVEVKYNCEGVVSTGTIIKSTREEILKVQKGFKYQT